MSIRDKPHAGLQSSRILIYYDDKIMMYAPNTTHTSLIVEPVSSTLSPDEVVVSFCRLREPAILESLIQPHTYARFSIFAFDPVDDFTTKISDASCPFQRLAERVAPHTTTAASPSGFPFHGGWIGYFTYEAGVLTGKNIASARPSHHLTDLALANFKLYDTAAVYDHDARQWFAVAVNLATSRTAMAERIQTITTLLQQAPSAIATYDCHPPTPSRVRSNMTYDQYIQKVLRAKAYIAAGDIFEVNLSQRFEVQVDASPEDIYRRLRAASPSSHAAFLPWRNMAVMSSSPELFLQLADGHVVTRPIKGTSPRGSDDVSDIYNRQALAASEKDRAELTMIVDLMRNDLGRVCEYGSVIVRESATIESLPHVFHQVAAVEGKLKSNATWLELLRATFPGGSITGAPKIRAMQIINELEQSPRGVYCGSIGLIGLDGSMSLNIAIRTMVQQGSTVRFDAGGAIVADSNPHQEYEEIMAKAKGMMQALNCTIHPSPIRNQELTPA